jgi:hypothetical protein
VTPNTWKNFTKTSQNTSDKVVSEEINLFSEDGNSVNDYQPTRCFNAKDCIKISNSLRISGFTQYKNKITKAALTKRN